jgi:hypothetical protein
VFTVTYLLAELRRRKGPTLPTAHGGLRAARLRPADALRHLD